MTQSWLLSCLACLIGLVPQRAVASQPEDVETSNVDPSSQSSSASPPSRPAALDAALGTPPSGGVYGADTEAQPGMADRVIQQSGEKTYGSTARSFGDDGAMVDGLQLYGDDLAGLETTTAEDVPEFHIVEEGDTLWKISDRYLRDSYLWPKLWSWNEHITNAHWIFPGDRVRVREGKRLSEAGGAGMQFSKTTRQDQPIKARYMLNQLAFVDNQRFSTAMMIVGGGDAKVMMATLDTIYMDYDQDNPPIAGERLIVYAPQEAIRDPKSGKKIGYIVQVMGEVEVDGVAEKAAEGTVVTAYHPIERGYRVGPLRRVFRQVEVVPPRRSVRGFIVASLVPAGPIPIKTRKPRRAKEPDVLVGEDVFVVTDLGTEDGVQVGNVLEAVRKGDAYTKRRVFSIPYVEGWPRRIVGRVLLVEVQRSTSLGIVIEATRELERGDHIELPGSGAGEPQSAR